MGTDEHFCKGQERTRKMTRSVVSDNRRPSVLLTRFPTDRKAHVWSRVTSFDLEEFLLRFKGTIACKYSIFFGFSVVIVSPRLTVQ